MPPPRFLPSTGYDQADAKKRTRPVVRALRRSYPEARTALTHHDAWELLIATILSAQCTDEVVNKVTPRLFERYPTPEALASAGPTDVEAIIKPTGFFRQKTRSIIATSRDIVDRFGGDVPRTVAELTTLRGVARKTANVVLANCYPRPQSDHGIFVDTHIRRISQRLAFTDQEDPVKIERQLMELLPKSAWVDVPHALILLGRGPCKARNPDHEACPLLRWCPTGLGARAEGAPEPLAATARRPRPARRTRARSDAARRG
ncbi:MAG TPA: endonuclease III [Actinomycetota bacterium]|nr:endonuclease III [Actinomycetota bacterium]